MAIPPTRINSTHALHLLPGRVRSILTACLMALCLATPAYAETTIQSIFGIAPGDRVAGKVMIGATAQGQTDAIHYKLSGPATLEVVRSGPTTTFMVDDEGKAAAWDATSVPVGDYTLSVYTLVNGEVDTKKSVDFEVVRLTSRAQTDTVQNTNEEAPVKGEEQVAQTQAASALTEVDLNTVFANYTGPMGAEGGKSAEQGDTDGDGDVDDVDLANHFAAYNASLAPGNRSRNRDDVTTTEEQNGTTSEQPTESAEPFRVGFGSTVGTTYQLGSGVTLALDTTGEISAQQDVLVLAWSVAEQRMVSEFAFTLSGNGPWQIPASKLEQLPAGVNNLQLLRRENEQVVERVTRDVTFVAAPTPFAIAFKSAPAEYEIGSGKSIALSPTGDLAEGADVLVIAWSVAESRLIDAFAFAIDGSPWTIPAGRLDLLPAGKVELQLITRDDRRQKVTHALTISAPAPAVPTITLPGATTFTQGETKALSISLSAPIPADCELVALAWSSREQRMVAEFAHELSKTDPVLSQKAMAFLPIGDNEIRVQVRRGGEVLKQLTTTVVIESKPEPVQAAPDPAVARFVGAPTRYTLGSAPAVNFEIENLPAGGDVLILAWSDSQGGLVDGFAHALSGSPWRIDASRMAMLPAGPIELQLIVRGGVERQKFVHRLSVIDPNTPVDDQTTNPTPDDNTSTDTETNDPDNGSNDSGQTDTSGSGDSSDSGSDSNSVNTGDNAADNPAPDFGSTAAGFFKPVRSADTRVIYVSSSRGSDDNDGLSENRPVKTLKRGESLLRSGKPDWLLLKAGDKWVRENLDFGLSGKSEQEPALIGVYGDGPRPQIIPPSGSNGINLTSDNINGLVIQGLHIYAATRDRKSGMYENREGEVDGIRLRLSNSENQYARLVLIEDCKISHFDTNIEVVDDWSRFQRKSNGDLQPGVPGRMKVIIRRNIIQFASGADSHSVGVYIEGSRNSVIEQNLLDHNGWAPSDGHSHRNKRSHNIYSQSFGGPVTVRENFISRGAAHGLQLRQGGTIERNLFVRNALGFFTSYHDSKANYNVILESDDMDSDDPQKWRGIGIEGWGMDYFEVIGNVVARRVGTLNRPALDTHGETLVVRDNRVFDWRDNNNDRSLWLKSGDLKRSSNITEEEFGGKEPPFVDPYRSVGDYARKIGVGDSLEDFIDAAASRPRGQWIDEYNPETVNRYIRAGFELKPHD